MCNCTPAAVCKFCRRLVNRVSAESGGAGRVRFLHQRGTRQVQSPLAAGCLPAAGLHSSPHALPRWKRPRAGAVLPDPQGAAGLPREQQEDGDPVSLTIPQTVTKSRNEENKHNI